MLFEAQMYKNILTSPLSSQANERKQPKMKNNENFFVFICFQKNCLYIYKSFKDKNSYYKQFKFINYG